MSGLPWVWGPRPAAGPACGRSERIAWRSVLVQAQPEAVYRWVCQLRVAPYSYDWLDNRGRRSPRTLVPGAQEVSVGFTMMGIFTLTSVEPGRSVRMGLTDRGALRLFGPLEVEYRTDPVAGGTLLCGRVVLGAASGPAGRMRDEALIWGDLVMMRKQLLTLGSLAEAAAGGSVQAVR